MNSTDGLDGKCFAADGVTPTYTASGLPIMVSAAEFNRVYSELAALRATPATAAEPENIYAELLQQIREAAGDPLGKLMQDELVAHIARMASPQAVVVDAVEVSDGYPFYELKFIMRVLGHKGQAPRQDWETAYGMARDIFMHWHKGQQPDVSANIQEGAAAFIDGEKFEVDAVIACLGDDAASLRVESPMNEEIADNMDRAADLLEKLSTNGAAAQAEPVETWTEFRNSDKTATHPPADVSGAGAVPADEKAFCWCIDSENSADWCFAADREGVLANAKLLDQDCIRSEPFELFRRPIATPATSEAGRLTDDQIMEIFQHHFPGHDCFQEQIDFARELLGSKA